LILELAGLNQNVTISFGITTLIKNDTKKSVLKRVDDALYEAKHTGRNRVKYI
jgi:PleD family two-component response regulator